MELLRITEGGYYPVIDLEGDYDDIACDGVVIDAPDAVVFIHLFFVSTVRVPLIVKRVGRLIINHYEPSSFWGDTANFRTGNIYIKHFRPSFIQQRFDYEKYHQDIVFQAYAVKDNGWDIDPNGLIENIVIDNIYVSSALKQVNGIMLSEVCQYRNFQIGTSSLHVDIESPYWLNTNNLQGSVLGGGDYSHIGSLSGEYEPTVRIQNVKGGDFGSEGNFICDVPHAEAAVFEEGLKIF